MVFSLLAVTGVHGQNGRVNLPGTSMTVKQVMESVLEQTNYLFAFDGRTFDTSRIVRTDATEASVEELAELITDGTGYSWLVSGTYIVIHPSPPPPLPPTVPKREPLPGPRTNDTYTPSEVGIDVFDTRPPEPDPTPELPQQPIREPVPVIVPEALPAPYSDYSDPDTYSPIKNTRPRGALKVDLLYGAVTLTPNIGFEVGLGTRSSIELNWGWNQLNHEGTRNNNKKLNHGLARIEYRWWFCEPYNGHFVGGNIFGTKYNVGGYNIPTLFERELRYEGWAAGVGLTYGYHLSLARRWGIDFHVGVGVARYHHTRFECVRCGNVIDRPKGYWFGPTRAGIDLVFLLW